MYQTAISSGNLKEKTKNAMRVKDARNDCLQVGWV